MLWKIKPCPLRDVKPDMVLARPILTESGKIALSENTVLTEQLISRLISMNIRTVYIKDSFSEAPSGRPSLYEAHRNFAKKHNEIVQTLKTAFEKTRYFKEVPLAQMSELADQTVESLINGTGVINHLKMLRGTDDYTFRHSVNVSIIAGILGKWLDFKGPELKELVLAGLLHDIGKTQIPLEILNKPDKLTADEMEIMEEHPTLGFELLKKAGSLPQNVLLAVWQHHEKLDGHGYPFNLPGTEICLNARIIAFADIYDAMTSDRVYRKAVTPFNVITQVFGDIFNQLDPTIGVTFLEHVKDSLIGYSVRLSDGSEARVIHLDKTRQVQPIVKLADGTYIDLEYRRDLEIVEVISTT